MDKETIKNAANQFITAIEADGYTIGFAGMPPTFPEYERPYNLQIYSQKLLEMGITEAIRYVVSKKHKHIPLDIRKILSGIQVCRKIEDIACREEDIIVNKIKYRPLTLPYQMLEMV